jgi:hypothetical protein
VDRDRQIEVHGIQPNIEGLVCEQLMAEEYWHDGNLVSSANVVYILVSSCWHRLTIDRGELFWRSSQPTPEPYQMSKLKSEVRIIDLGILYGVKQLVLDRIDSKTIDDGAAVIFVFRGGRTVRFSNVDDSTSHGS